MIIPSEDEIITINKKLGYGVMNKGTLEFLIARLKSMRLTEEEKRNITKAAGSIWFHIISQHPFSDGNKRTATETVQYFLELNKYTLEIPPNGRIYLSLQIANNDITIQVLTEKIYQQLKVKE